MSRAYVYGEFGVPGPAQNFNDMTFQGNTNSTICNFKIPAGTVVVIVIPTATELMHGDRD